MPNLISENDIERAMVQRLQHLYGYDALIRFTTDPADLNDGSGRTDERDVILHDRLRNAAIGLDPKIPQSAIDEAHRTQYESLEGIMTRRCSRRSATRSSSSHSISRSITRNGRHDRIYGTRELVEHPHNRGKLFGHHQSKPQISQISADKNTEKHLRKSALSAVNNPGVPGRL